MALACYYGTFFTRVTVPLAQNKFGGHRPVNDCATLSWHIVLWGR
jgi:hypothetical protein